MTNSVDRVIYIMMSLECVDNVIMHLSTKWEIITRRLRYALGFRNDVDDRLTIGGHVLGCSIY